MKPLLEELRTDVRKPWRRSLTQFKEVHKVVLPHFNKEVYTAAGVNGDEELIILPLKDQGTQKRFVNTSKMQKEMWRPPLMKEDWVVLCQAPYQSIKEEEWIDMHEQLK